MEFLEGSTENVEKRPMPMFARVAIGVAGGLGVAITVVCLPFISPAFRRVCLPYVPASPAQVSNVLEALRGRTGTLVDLGSGDGRIVLAAAKQGFQSTGVELNRWLLLYSRLASLRSKLSNSASFKKCDLWKFDLKPFNNVVIFGVDEMMVELEQKFLKELTQDSCIVACRFPLPNLRPMKTIGADIDRVWVYKI